MAPVSVRSSAGIRPGPCSLMEPCMTLTEDCGVLVGRTLVDASSWSANVLMVNPSSDVIVLPSFSCVGNLEDIVTGSHPSLGEAGRLSLRSLLHRYDHVFPAPGEPVTGHTTPVQHEILTSDAQPIRCGPRPVGPGPVSEPNRRALKKCYWGDRLNPVIVHGRPLWS